MHIVVYRKKMTVETKGFGHIEEPLPARGASVTYTGKRGRLRLPRRPPPGHGGGDGAGGGCPALRRGPQPAGVRRAVYRLSPPGGGRAGHCRGTTREIAILSRVASRSVFRSQLWRNPAASSGPASPAAGPSRPPWTPCLPGCIPAVSSGCGHPPGVLRGLCGHRLRRSLPDRGLKTSPSPASPTPTSGSGWGRPSSPWYRSWTPSWGGCT